MGFLQKIEITAMSNLLAADTGVKNAVLWVSAGEFGGKDCAHGPRLKVMLGNKITSEGLDKATTVTLTSKPAVFGEIPAKVKKDVIKFIDLNLLILLQYWNNEISTREMLVAIQRI